MEQQEYFIKVQMLGQEAEKIEQQIQAIDQQITELNAVKESLEAIKNNKDKTSEILTNLGKGIFIKTEIKSKDLFVNIGREVVVKKTFEETLEIIDEQNSRMMAGKEELIGRIQELQEEMQELMGGINNGNTLGEHSHECEDEDCECEEPCDDCTCKHEHGKK